jgi:hypothetical protein
MSNDWDKYRQDVVDKASGVLTPEVIEALDFAGNPVEETSDFIPDEITKVAERNKRDKLIRRAEHNSWKREPIDGYSLKHSNIAREVIGLKYSNYALREAFKYAAEARSMSPVTIEHLYYNKRKLFELAEVEHIGNAIQEYNFNKAVCSTMLSQIGPRMVQVLADVAENPDSTQNVRLKAAVAALKLLGVGDSNSDGMGGKSAAVVSEALRSVKKIQDGIEGGDSHVIDAEVVQEGNDCEDRTIAAL